MVTSRSPVSSSPTTGGSSSDSPAPISSPGCGGEFEIDGKDKLWNLLCAIALAVERPKKATKTSLTNAVNDANHRRATATSRKTGALAAADRKAVYAQRAADRLTADEQREAARRFLSRR